MEVREGEDACFPGVLKFLGHHGFRRFGVRFLGGGRRSHGGAGSRVSQYITGPYRLSSILQKKMLFSLGQIYIRDLDIWSRHGWKCLLVVSKYATGLYMHLGLHIKHKITFFVRHGVC